MKKFKFLPGRSTGSKERKVYHVTSPRNTQKVLAEGLLPMVSTERGQDLQIVDIVFDRVAKRLGIVHRRTNLFAWLSRERARYQIDLALEELGQRPILEVTIDPKDAIVAHQDYVSLAYTSVFRVISLTGMNYLRHGGDFDKLTMLQELSGEDLIALLSISGQLRDPYLVNLAAQLVPLLRRVETIGELYWRTAVPLTEYDEKTARELDDRTRIELSQIVINSGGIKELNHEAIINEDKIPSGKIREV